MITRETERLIELSRVVLPTVNNDFFSLDVWSCGSCACAIGYAGTHYPFNAEGFELIENENCYLDKKGVPELFPVFNGFRGWNAAAQFFGLSPQETERLFKEEYYRPNGFNVDDSGEITDPILKEEVIEKIEAYLIKSGRIK